MEMFHSSTWVSKPIRNVRSNALKAISSTLRTMTEEAVAPKKRPSQAREALLVSVAYVLLGPKSDFGA